MGIETINQKLNEYSDLDYYPLHMPGHKRNGFGCMSKEYASIDITEINGFDNLHNAEGIIKASQDRYAKYVGADNTYFLINGSSCGVLAAISCCTSKGGKIAIVRNAHKSAYHAILVRELDPIYICPSQADCFDIYDIVYPWQISMTLEENSDIEAVFIVSPTYEGRIADIEAISNIVHSYGIPLIVDEAHGAHLSFAKGIDGFGKSAIAAGADIVIQSVHKTLPAPTQTAVLHVIGNRVNKQKLEKFLHIYQTSSPSYPLMAGIENAFEIMKESGKALLEGLKDNYFYVLEEIKKLKVIETLPFKSGEQDIGKLVLSARRAHLLGAELADILRSKFHLEVEMYGTDYCLAMLTVGDTKDGISRLVNALKCIDDDYQNQAICDIMYIPSGEELSIPKKITKPSESWEKASEAVFLEATNGKCCADFVVPYPPGFPILVPGEIISSIQIELIRDLVASKIEVLGIEISESGEVMVPCLL